MSSEEDPPSPSSSAGGGDSGPGELEDFHEDDSKLKPSDRNQFLMTLCFACIEGFSTDRPPCNHKLFDKMKKKHRVTISFLKQEIKRRKPDFKGLSNKKADELVSILKKDDMELPSEDKSFVESQEKAYRESLERLIEESTGNSPAKCFVRGRNL